MKTGKIILMLLIMLFAWSISTKVLAQSAEAQQLLLNVEKLSQLKNILNDMKKGYSVISTGYNAVKNISKGNFSIHKVFLDGLMLVSPEVRKYRRVADIISCQKNIAAEYRNAFKRFSSAGLMNPRELDYLRRLYGTLLSQSVDNLDELTMVVTSNALRMSDDERLAAIDRIYADASQKLSFLKSFNRDASLMLLQRKAAMQDIRGSKDLFNTN